MTRRTECSFVNELGNHIVVDAWRVGDEITTRIAGPTSLHENTITLMEAAEIHRQLGYLLAARDGAAEADPPA